MFLKVVTVQRIIKALLAAGVVCCLFYIALIDYSLRPNNGLPIHIAAPGYGSLDHPHHMQQQQVVQPFESIIPEKYNEAVVKTRLISEKIKRLTGMVIHPETLPVSNRTDLKSYNVQIFYYCPVDWWTATGHSNHSSDDSLNISFYPEMGTYNCSADVVAKHFSQINKTGIGVILYSWTENGTAPELMEAILNEAARFQLKLSFVLESFQGRTVQRIRDQIEFITSRYSHHESFNRIWNEERKALYPVFYVKDTLNSGIKETSWRELLGAKQSHSIRKTKFDAIILNHIVTKDSLAASKRSGFDGFFTYSASNGETFGSTWKNWKEISRYADQYKMLFVPTLGPGYVEKIWKGEPGQKQKHHAVRHRGNGNYYGVGWRTAIQLTDPFVSISSFNNWAEGTQIEPAVQRVSFRDYANKSGNYSSTKYLDLTKWWVEEFTDKKTEAGANQHFCHRKEAAAEDGNGSKFSHVKGLKRSRM